VDRYALLCTAVLRATAVWHHALTERVGSQGFLRGNATEEQAAEVVVHAWGTPVRGWLWDERRALGGKRPASAKRPGSARKAAAADAAVPIMNGYRVEALGCTLGGVVPPVDLMVWVTAAAGGAAEWRCCESQHWPHPHASLLLACVLSVDVGPQALWTDVGLKLSPARRATVPAGLLCGLREPHAVRELLRLYTQLPGGEAAAAGEPRAETAVSVPYEVPVPTAAELRLASGRKPYIPSSKVTDTAAGADDTSVGKRRAASKQGGKGSGAETLPGARSSSGRR
jgi:hypothetical protein